VGEKVGVKRAKISMGEVLSLGFTSPMHASVPSLFFFFSLSLLSPPSL